MRRLTSVFVLLLAGTAACDRTANGEVAQAEQQSSTARPAPNVNFDTTAIQVRTASASYDLTVELAERNEQRMLGLMDRDSLAADAGMIFIYEDMQSPQSGFWMYRTLVPLDIAFFDGAGRIVAILSMEPCPSLDSTRCQSYVPNAAYYGALEMNRGWFAQRGVRVGDRVVMPGRFGERDLP